MAAINKGKHVIEEIDGKRCTVVEKGIDQARMAFLKDLLEFNKHKVVVKEEESTEGLKTYTIAVDDLIFNPVIWLYERRFKTKNGEIVSPAYWNQYNTKNQYMYWKYIKGQPIPDEYEY